MTPLNPHQQRGPESTSGIVLGVIACFGLMCLGSTGEFFVYQRAKKQAREGWNLIPVVVAAIDVEPSSLVTFEMISQRSIPEQFASKNIVKPDSASYVVNQRVRVRLQAGDALRWSDFEVPKDELTVLFATRDLAANTVLVDSDVTARFVKLKDVTKSWARKDDTPKIVGQPLRVALRAGDPILWQQLSANGVAP